MVRRFAIILAFNLLSNPIIIRNNGAAIGQLIIIFDDSNNTITTTLEENQQKEFHGQVRSITFHRSDKNKNTCRQVTVRPLDTEIVLEKNKATHYPRKCGNCCAIQ